LKTRDTAARRGHVAASLPPGALVLCPPAPPRETVVPPSYQARHPPSTWRMAPVTYDAPGEARKIMAPSSSPSLPSRPIGVNSSIRARCSSCTRPRRGSVIIAVGNQEGARALTVIPYGAHSTASWRVILVTAPLVAA